MNSTRSRKSPDPLPAGFFPKDDGAPAETSGHVIQSMLLPMGGLPASLYLRQMDDRGRELPPLVEAGVVHLLQDEILSTDTFFGAFYRAYWLHYAEIGILSLAVRVQGIVDIRVMEDTGAGVTCRHREVRRADRPTTFHITPSLSMAAGIPNSRLYFEVMALVPSMLYALDVLCSAAPVRLPTLSIGLCTFNQEAYFARTLAHLTALADRHPDVLRIHVVNQGAPFASPEIRALVAHPAVRLIQQRNLGGCGGFTRSLMEELAEVSPATHHLMMDDDIVLDERLIERALTFAAYTVRDCAIGAGMLDSLRPTVMHEAGAFLQDSNRIEPYCHNVDLADLGQHWRFNTPVMTDYNAWWFCMLPVERSRALGLPAPVFIRGDDFEYGQRLARAGVPTVTLPGIGVWHEPFYAKPPGWQDYYDLRNRLIFGATYGDKVRQLSVAHVTGLVTTAALTHDYTTARLRLMAISDFLKGPTSLFGEDPEATHARVMAVARAKPAEKLGAEWIAKPLAPAGPPRATQMRKLMVQQARALWRNLFSMGIADDPRAPLVLLDTDAQPLRVAGRTYVVTNGLRSFHLRFTPDRAALRQVMGDAIRLARRFRAESAAANDAWASAIATYRTPDWWQAHFAAPDQPAPGENPNAS